MEQDNNLIKHKKIRLNLKYRRHKEVWKILCLVQKSSSFKSINEFIIESILAYQNVLMKSLEEDKNDELDRIVIKEPPLF